jgi:hypothetical protein
VEQKDWQSPDWATISHASKPLVSVTRYSDCLGDEHRGEGTWIECT